MSDDSLRGRFVWHELMTPDPKAAMAFYSKVVGWKVQAWEKDPSYTILLAAGRPIAGVMVLPAEAKAMGAPPHWLTYIGTPDVDATARLAAELGGRVLKPAMDIPDVGRFAVLQDLQGAVFAAFKPARGPMGGDKPGLGDFSWHELATTDWPAAFGFYQELFGWEKTESMDMGPGGTYQMFGWKGNTIGGTFTKPPNMAGPAYWMPYAVVADSKGAATIVKKLGGKITNGPREIPGGDWIVQLVDLQGAHFAVHSRKQAAARTPARRRPAKTAKPAGRPAHAAARVKTAKKVKASKKKATPKRAAPKKAAPSKRSRRKVTRSSTPRRAKTAARKRR